ncbi:MAG: Gfo/Idh/MocA family oxidoreductase [Pirellulales bacterium]
MPSPQNHRTSRRGVLRSTAATATTALVQRISPLGTFRAAVADKRGDLGIGVIGCRYQGSVIAGLAKSHGRLLAMADVDASVRDLSAIDPSVEKQTGLSPESIYEGVGRHEDYRRLLDDHRIHVILIGTPDHWHAGMLIDALKAGKDVYVEKPITLTIDEGKQIRKVMKTTGGIVQVGSWQRSDHRFRTAVEMVHAGRIGQLKRLEVALGSNEVGGPFATAATPESLNWERWLGQALLVPYTKERCHYTFRWWFDYAGGKMTDHGAHHLDIAQWAIGTDPIEVIPEATMPKVNNGYNVPTAFRVLFRYPNDVEMLVTDTGRNGILFEGSEGRIFVNRGSLTGVPVDELAEKPLPHDAFRLYDFDNLDRPKRTGKIEAIVNHMGNFFDCIAARRQPISDAESQHRSATTCHLGNIACRLGRPLGWDATAERFESDEEANGLLSRPQRKGYEVSA